MKKAFLAASILAVTSSAATAAVPSDAGYTSTDKSKIAVNTKQYHSYDGLICTDCHTLHNSDDNKPLAGSRTTGDWTPGPYATLLKKGDYTDMCLSCHKEGFNTSATADLKDVEDTGWKAPIVMTLNGTPPPNVAMPAGDFFYSATDAKKGHNPSWTKNASGPTSLLLPGDTTLGKTPPGGTALVDNEWSCHSCHGMHSRFSAGYTAWRQLQRKVNGVVVSGDVTSFGVESVTGDKGATAAGYEPIKSNSRGDLVNNGLDFVNVRADGNALEGADLMATYGDTNKNVYRGGFSSFCSACHGDFHGGNAGSSGSEGTLIGQNTNVRQSDGQYIRHPTNLQLGQAGASKYGVAGYTAVVVNKQGTNPNPTGYDWKYPLIQPDSDFQVKRNVAGGPVLGADRLSCLTCHKAHAAKFDNMVRWDANGHSFIANAEIDFEGETSNGDNPAYGCGKCHQKGGTRAYVRGSF